MLPTPHRVRSESAGALVAAAAGLVGSIIAIASQAAIKTVIDCDGGPLNQWTCEAGGACAAVVIQH